MKLEQADALAERFHSGQVDKAGRAYIDHPRRVSTLVNAHEEKLAALLHDLLEDTALTPVDLLCAGTNERVLQAVVALSRVKGESYRDFILRAARNPIARAVKIADITDNNNEDRLQLLDSKVASRLRAKYIGALALLRDDAESNVNSTDIDFDSLTPEGDALVWWTSYCDECGHPAGTVEIIRDDVEDTGRRVGVSLKVYCALGTANIRVPMEQMEWCRNAVAIGNIPVLHSIDREITPWWCGVCAMSYCERSWAFQEQYNDGRFDGVRGRCPKGHSRIVWD